jgi:hypothetical protein
LVEVLEFEVVGVPRDAGWFLIQSVFHGSGNDLPHFSG